MNDINFFVAADGYVTARSADICDFVDDSLQGIEKRFGPKVTSINRTCLLVNAFVKGLRAVKTGAY